MDKIEVSYRFKRKVYVGKIYLLDINSRAVVVTGYGSFNTEALSLDVQFDANLLSAHDRVLTVLETPDGYFAPLMLRDFHSMGWSGQSSRHSMKLSMHWPLSKGAEYVLEEFDEIRIAIDAIPEKQVLTHKIDKDGKNGKIHFEKSASFTNLSAANFSQYSAEANSTYSWSSGNVSVRSASPLGMSGLIAFTVKDMAGKNFGFQSLNTVLFAFKSYWLLTHSTTDCNIVHFKLGADIDFIFEHNKLYAPHSDIPEFRSIISVETELYLETFLRCLYFATNPSMSDELSITSKIGLSLSSLVRHAYNKRPELLDHEVVSLIVGFQGLSEAIARNTIRQANKADKAKTLAEIDAVLAAIKSMDSKLSDDIKDFYLKDRNVIYQLMSRPTFKRSVEIALNVLGIDKSKHDSTITAIDKARKQIVHFENYNSDSLIDLITTANNEVKKDKNGDIVQMSFGVKIGELDNLYNLMLDMMQRYFKNLEADLKPATPSMSNKKAGDK